MKDGNPIDGHFLQVANYSYYLDDVPSSVLSDDDFSPVIFSELCLFQFCAFLSMTIRKTVSQDFSLIAFLLTFGRRNVKNCIRESRMAV